VPAQAKITGLQHLKFTTFDLGQILFGSGGCGQLLKYNGRYVEIRVAVVQYQSVIPYLVETLLRRIFRLNY
jgi:hypothetical protein